MDKMIHLLLEDLTKIKHRYQQAREGKVFNFEEDIQPFIETIDKHLDLLKQHRTSILNQPYETATKFSQLISLIEEISVSCHYAKTSKKIFVEQSKTVYNHLNDLL